MLLAVYILVCVAVLYPMMYLMSFVVARGFYDGKLTAVEKAIRRNSKGLK